MKYKNQKKYYKLKSKIDRLSYEIDLKNVELEYLSETINLEEETLNKKQEEKIKKLESKQQKKSARLEQKKIAKIEHRKLNEPPKLPTLEEVGNSVSHGIGAVFALVAIVLLLLKSTEPLEIVASLVYGMSIFIMMLSSCLYHAFKSRSKVKRVFRRFDYASIYLLIGGTFAPILLVDLSGTLGAVLFGVQWAIIFLGITLTSVFGPGRFKWIHFTLYFTIGWSGILFVPGWIRTNIPLLLFILGGGLVYTLGMIPFAKRGTPAAHFIWHIFVLLGCIVQFLGIYLYIY